MLTLNLTIALRQLRGNNCIEEELQAMKVIYLMIRYEFIQQSHDYHVIHLG